MSEAFNSLEKSAATAKKISNLLKHNIEMIYINVNSLFGIESSHFDVNIFAERLKMTKKKEIRP